MKLAILLQCHKNPEQINRLLDTLLYPAVDIYVHVDKKSEIADRIMQESSIHIIDEKQRVSVSWGGYTQVEATLNLLREAAKNRAYDYFWLISGQDFLLKPIGRIVESLESSSSMNYIDCFYGEPFEKRCQIYYPQWMIGRSLRARIGRKLWINVTGGEKRTFSAITRKHQPAKRYYAGSSWWCMSGEFIRWAVQYLDENPRFENYFRNTICPDEEFFQTLFMISPYKDKKADKICYVDWSNLQNSPRILEEKDFELLISSEKWIARKFDSDVDERVISRLEELIRK